MNYTIYNQATSRLERSDLLLLVIRNKSSIGKSQVSKQSIKLIMLLIRSTRFSALPQLELQPII